MLESNEKYFYPDLPDPPDFSFICDNNDARVRIKAKWTNSGVAFDKVASLFRDNLNEAGNLYSSEWLSQWHEAILVDYKSGDRRVMQIINSKGTVYWYFTCSCPSGEWDTYKDDFRNILMSYKRLKS
jgi:hypothetical protein